MNKTFWNYIKKHPFLTVIVLTIIITILLHITGIYLFEYWTGNKNIAVKNDFDIFGGVISYVGGVLSVITIIFLYINYHQVKEQNDKNNQDTEFNRVLDIIYKQLEFTNNELKEYDKEMNENLGITLTLQSSIHRIQQYCWMFKILDTNYSIFDKILDSSNLVKENKKIIVDIISTNFYIKPSLYYMQFKALVDSVGGKDDYKKQCMDYVSLEKAKLEDNLNRYSRVFGDRDKAYYEFLNRLEEYLYDVFENSKELDKYLHIYKK